ncbi:MAG: hypothetical protein H7641_09590 [Candidatus Heimdallarchaeota archaeon]|nr:hypothetical protein [Candidatus Heimdallarchaeota archaeon]MCK4877815.1 hypothetical protein [Candidatus Heimdallarchaeota archaeon]
MAKFLTILLAEAAIEPFPEELLKDIKVRQYLSKLKKSADEVLLDMSYHSHLVEKLPDAEKRGRPDIAHFALLSCFGSILARDHRLNVIIHTYHDKIIHLHPDIRLPKNIERFNGLLIQLFKEEQVPPESQKPLMTLSDSSLSNLVNELRNKHDLVIEFSVKGEQMSSSEYSELIHNATNPLLIFGAYPQGKLRGLTDGLVDRKIAIYEEGLDLFAVISQILASQQMIEEKLAKMNLSEEEKLSWE